MFALEKQHLIPVPSFETVVPESIVTYQVRKDNTVVYHSNRYQVDVYKRQVIDLQDDYSKALEYQNYAEIREKSARDFLQEVFEDEYIDTINGEDKQKIKEFVQQLMKKWEE